ncbi:MULTISPECIES: lipoyl(octanoyl) transferase LipB [unclassified Polynucleobacter]|jgi:lipoyl(octanoyl) transferase|uniref:lipoyl(octanoyl) transferase LipB n=1 Tax=unclassified Polynucleobacter TaxID=2640945 RepID=UPI001BFDF935|nr:MULTISPECIES: lipoyl(octanoyl) transferase LipB [unclassified Polynucleobacter]MBU3638081.1 lipoyl(octanoyl) transferase LipB [Polynucleobacter sp. AP-RePozz3-80-G7]MEA9600591.1 lipoyl(octanoyl) transferase LipB [Polynucleobacter sp. MG-28-Ekke-A2]QWD81483.1 lipoyl(octanoyl) transferase LipB [Polynucleobacter sp. MWH-S4W17]
MAALVKQLGLADYASTYEAMKLFTKERTNETPDEIWVLEHPPVFTLGLAGDAGNLHSPSNQIPLVQVDRGGEITYHGPGQIVVYLLLDLKRLGIFVKELVSRIEQALIDTLADFGIKAERHQGAPGIYVSQQPGVPSEWIGAKVAALGLKVSKSCSYHGLALNVATDLEAFQRIHPCGYEGLKTVDMQTLGIKDNVDTISQRLLQHLQKQLMPS